MVGDIIRQLAAVLIVGQVIAAETNHESKVFTHLGCIAKLETMKQVKEGGADFVTVGTFEFTCPDEPEDSFDRNLAKARKAGVRVLACNGFLRGGRHTIVGPEPMHDAALAWADTVCRRMVKAGGKFIVLGSAATRRIPDGWTKDQADEQFVAFLKRLGPVAQKHGITIVVEQLRKEECNFLNHIDHLGGLIRKVDHPHVRALADLYHMASVGDTPEDLKRNLDVVVHLEIAEKSGRTYPGVQGDDFRPYFRVLSDAGWKGAINIEGKGDAAQLPAAFHEIRRQEADVVMAGKQ